MDIEMVDLLRKMVDEAPFGMYVLDGERKIVFWSQGAEHITGYSREEMVGKHCFQRRPGSYRQHGSSFMP